MDDQGIISSLMTVKIGAVDHYLPHTRMELYYLFSDLSKKDSTGLLDAAGKIAIACSQMFPYNILSQR